MKVFSIFFIIFLCCQTAEAQRNGIIRGTLTDTAMKRPVSFATVSLLQKKDSSLVSFVMTDDNGHFEFKNLAPGEYRLLLTHINYHNLSRSVTVNDNDKLTDLGSVIMTDKNKLLDEVTLVAEAPPVTIINDTIQYNANSFKTPPNANVEQLLKKLPGIKVEKDGTVKAQGEKVNRVLVDGKEFFGNDPKIATKNLPADAIDKVQVYDKQSDQAQLTGFDDGNYEKTINLKLKKDRKKGMFGKLNADGGTDNRYAGRFNMNSFKGARQFSALAMGNNNNTEGFTFSDILNFTGELNRMMKSGGGDLNINFSNRDAAAWGLGNNNAGINTIRGGGINYNNIIGNKTDMQSNYFYNRYAPYTDSHILRQYLLPDSSYFYRQDAVSNNINDNQRLNLNALYQIDSANSIRITPSFGYQKTNNRSQSSYSISAGNGAVSNRGYSNNANTDEGYNFKNDIIYRRKINHRGRTFSFDLQTSFNHSKGNGSILSNNDFFNAGGIRSATDTINQLYQTAADLRGYTAKAVYTEPLFKRSLLEFSISNSNTKSNAEKITNNYNAFSGKYDQPDSLFSNDYESVYNFTRESIRLRKQKHKYRYSFGASLQHAFLHGRMLSNSKDPVIKKNFSDVLPEASFQYNFSKFKGLSMRYNTGTNQPDITQLQPVPDNRDPLNIKAGNPLLKQEYAHNLQANMNFVNPYKNRSLFFLLNVQAVQNKIVNADSLSATGIKYTRPVNTNGAYSINNNISYSFHVNFLKSNIELGANTGYNSGRQFTNGAADHIRSLVFGPSVRMDMNPQDKVSFSLGAAYTVNHTSYSLEPSLTAKYLSQQYSAGVDWEMPKHFFLSTDFEYTLNSGRAKEFNTNTPLWNASLSRQVLKYNRGEIKFTATDLLNSNAGISRSSNQNYIEDSRVRTVRRFFMLGFTYSLSKTGLNNTGDGGGMRVIAR